MQKFQIKQMYDYAQSQIDRIAALEQLCKSADRSGLRIGAANLKPGGDEAFLCYYGQELTGCLAWYTSDGEEANVNAMVHPRFRRQGVFQGLLDRAVREMETRGLRTCRFRVPSDSEPGLGCIRHLGAEYRESEYSMMLDRDLATPDSVHSGLELSAAQPQDLEFMVACSSQAFGDSEEWTRSYFARTSEPERAAYLALDRGTPVGMIRVNHVDRDTAVIHDFCVLPAYQGAGYGGHILALTVGLLLERSCPLIRLNVVTENTRALRLYLSAGFKTVGEFQYYTESVGTLRYKKA